MRRYDTTTSSRPRILEVARKKAAELGYEQLKLSDITEAAEISHQGFYIHFKNKRHAVAVATSDQLGAVATLVSNSSGEDEAWAKRLEDEIDNALAEAYPAEHGPESRLRDKLVEVLAAKSFPQTRIAELVKASGLGHGEFYRRYGGKNGCLQRIHGRALAALRDELGDQLDLLVLAGALALDPPRAGLLVLGGSELPRGPEHEKTVSTQESFPALVKEVLAAGGHRDRIAVDVAGGAFLETLRHRVIDHAVKQLPADAEFILRGLGAAEPPEVSSPPPLAVAA